MIIGRQGCVIREMQSKTGTRIQIPSQPTPGMPNRVATISGPADGCQIVKSHIERMISEQSSQSVMSGTAGGAVYGQQYGQQQYGQQYGQQQYGQQYQQQGQQYAQYGQQTQQTQASTTGQQDYSKGN